MCDYSLTMFASRPAAAGDKLVTKKFGTGSTGLVDGADSNVAVCLLPGTELAFAEPVRTYADDIAAYTTGKFVQLHKETPFCHHDAVEFLNVEYVAGAELREKLENPLKFQWGAGGAKDRAGSEEQKRAEFVG